MAGAAWLQVASAEAIPDQLLQRAPEAARDAAIHPTASFPEVSPARGETERRSSPSSLPNLPGEESHWTPSCATFPADEAVMQPLALREEELLQPLEWEPSQIHSAVLLQPQALLSKELLPPLEWEPSQIHSVVLLQPQALLS